MQERGEGIAPRLSRQGPYTPVF